MKVTYDRLWSGLPVCFALFVFLLLNPRVASAESVTRTGIYRIIDIDKPDNTHQEEHTLKTSDRRYTLIFTDLNLIRDVPSGTRITVTGNLTDSGEIYVQNLNIVSWAQAMAGPTAVGDKKIAVFLVNFIDDRRQPITVENARNVMFVQTHSWYKAVSYEKMTSITGDVFGYYELDISSASDYRLIESETRRIAAANGVNFSLYDNYAYVFPDSRRGWTALGEMPGDTTWYNGYFGLRYTTHELGHNLGLHHSNGLDCGEVTMKTPLGSSCQSREYDDYFDSMGRRPYHFNGYWKQKLNWLEPSDVLTVTTSGEYEINPIAVATSPVKVLKVESVVDGQRITYYLESRIKYGADMGITTPRVLNGLVIRAWTSMSIGGVTGRTVILDNTPENDFTDTGLLIGESFTEPGGITFTPLYKDSDVLRVRIDMNPASQAGFVQFRQTAAWVGESQGAVNIEVERLYYAQGAVDVSYQTENISALAGQDYTSTSGSLHFNNGELGIKTISVPILNDTVTESPEQFRMRLLNPTNGLQLGTNSSMTVNIGDDDIPAMTVNAGEDQTIVLPQSANLSCQVTNSPREDALKYVWSLLSGPAAVNFSSPHMATTMAAFSQAGVYVIQIEVSSVTMEPGSGNRPVTDTVEIQVLGPNSPGVLEISPLVVSVPEGAGHVDIQIVRKDGSSGELAFEYGTISISATPDLDYTPQTGSRVFADGNSDPITISIPIIDDSSDETHEQFRFELYPINQNQGDGSPTVSTVTIHDDDTHVVVNAGPDQTILFGEQANFTGTVSLGVKPLLYSSTWSLTSGPGPVQWDDPYRLDTHGHFSAVGDFHLQLEVEYWDTVGVVHGRVSDDLMVTVIENPSDPAGKVEFQLADVGVNEAGGNVSLAVVRKEGSFGDVSVSYQTTDLTASAGSDYAPSQGEVVYFNGETGIKFITIPIFNDGDVETEEVFTVTLANPTHNLELGAQINCRVSITSEDVAPPSAPPSSPRTVFNPKNGEDAVIPFTMSREGEVTIKIYTSRGDLVQTILSGFVPLGPQTATWDGRNSHGSYVVSDLYLALIKKPDGVERRKLVVLN